MDSSRPDVSLCLLQHCLDARIPVHDHLGSKHDTPRLDTRLHEVTNLEAYRIAGSLGDGYLESWSNSCQSHLPIFILSYFLTVRLADWSVQPMRTSHS